MATEEQVAATVAEMRARGLYVNARGLTNSKGAAHLLGITEGTLDNWHSKRRPVPRSCRPSGPRGPRYFLVAEVLAFIDAREQLTSK
jgi:hypothetical protein